MLMDDGKEFKRNEKRKEKFKERPRIILMNYNNHGKQISFLHSEI
jgi:hypothetical protein